MKVIYVAGPYRSKTERSIVENIRNAESIAIEIWKAGYVALTPHLNTRLFGGICDDSVWLQGDLELLRRCDAVVLVPGWEKSIGTQTEIIEAKKVGIPIFTDIKQIRF